MRRLMSATGMGGERRGLWFVPVIGFVLASGGLAMLPPAALAGTKPAGGTVGSLTFSGQLRGNLKIPRKWDEGPGLSTFGCLYGYHTPKQPLIRFYDEKLSLNGHAQAFGELQLELTVTHLGQAEALTPKTSGYSQVLATLTIGSHTYVWGSDAGTLDLKKSGSGGSMHATLTPGGHDGTPFDKTSPGDATQSLEISGSWSFCNNGIAG